MSYIDYLDSLSKKQLMVMLARQRQDETQGIAIVGMGCRLPGGINDPRSLWAMLRDGRVVPTESAGPPVDSLGRARWNLAAPDLAPMAALLSAGAYLDDVDLFAADHFGITDDEAMQMDPQQRLLIEVSVQALADANLTRAELRRRKVGIFVGASTVEYPVARLRNGKVFDGLSPHMALGNTLSATAGRLGFTLGVNGPAMTIETSSSSALTAMHLAAQSLRRRECDVALVGACQLLLSPVTTAVLGKPGMLSGTGRSRPFTSGADGHVRGEGCGVLVLKRHSDVAADGDLPYALLRGSAVHSQGDRPSMPVSTMPGQKTVIDLALRNAGVEPLDVQYVEAQANGSRLGGIIEAETLADAYQRRSPTARPLYLGSCKANLGYLETASGAAGLMKTALALAHGEIPPQPGVDDLDPGVGWDRTALRLADKPTPWPAADRRLAGVSAFGFTGINAHVILEAVPGRPQPEPAGVAPGTPALLVLSGHSAAALAGTAAALHAYLDQRAEWDYDAVCRTLANGRDHLGVRYAAVVTGRSGLLEALTAVEPTPSTVDLDAPAGVVLDLPALDDAQVRSVLARSSAAGFEALDARIRERAGAMGLDLATAPAGDAARAWAQGWHDLLVAVGLRVTDGGPAGAVRVAPAELDVSGWLGLVGARYAAGADLTLAALSTRPRRGLYRLPGPVLAGRSYWPDGHRWS